MVSTRPPAGRLTLKLPLLIAATALCVALCAGTVASLSFYDAARQMIITNLSVQAHNKREALTTLIGTVRRDLIGAAANPAVNRSLDKLAIGFKILKPDERRRLPAKYAAEVAPSADAVNGLSDFYEREYGSIHSWFKGFARDHGFADVLFVDRDGNVAYTLAKRADYGINIHDAALAGTPLATVYGHLMGQPSGATVTTDFAAYAPDGHPVSLVATPVYQFLGSTPDFVGILVFELPAARIDAILNEPDGFGANGEAIVVGADGRLRTHSRFDATGNPLDTRFEDAALIAPGPTGLVSTTKGYRGHAMIAAAFPLLDRDLRWSVVAAESSDELFRPVRRMIARIAVISLIVTMLLALVAAGTARRIARPIVELVERFDAALRNMSHGLAMFNARDDLILCNAAYSTMYRLPPELAAAGTSHKAISAYRNAHGMARTTVARDGDRDASGCLLLEDGRRIDILRNPIPSGGYVATHYDVTEAVRAQEQIRHLASHDALTGLPNRSQLREKMTIVLDSLWADTRLAVLCLDLDHFKTVNDTLGHPVGDLLLKAVTGRLRGCLRDTDVLARLGGDEFVVLQTGIESPEEAGALALRLIQVTGTPFELDGHQVVVGLSVGIAMTPGDGADSDTLIKNADMALYRAKADGRGSSRFFEPEMDAKLQDRRRLELDLRHALATEQFWLSYQPLFDSQTERMTGVEALLRWSHPERGLVSPVDFIPVAEEMGLIVPLGEWVIRRACNDAAGWPSHIKVAVNLSALQLKNSQLIHTIVSALAKSGLAPMRLELEITESVLMTDSESTLAMLHALRMLGVRIAMDDFGTGYSSLSYLRSFPFDKIKIDRSFIKDLSTSAGSTAIIKAVSDLGISLGMVTTAEGVETEEQLAMVRGHGCVEVQGFLFSKPRPAAEITQLCEDEDKEQRRSA